MIDYFVFITVGIALAAFLLTIFLKGKVKIPFGLKIYSLLTALSFLTWNFCKVEIATSSAVNIFLTESNFAPNIIGAFTFWSLMPVVVLLVLRGFYSLKTSNNLIKYLGAISLILNIIFFRNVNLLILGNSDSFTSFLGSLTYAILIGFVAYGVFYSWLIDHSFKMSRKEAIAFVFAFIGVLLVAIPCFIPQILLVKGSVRWEVKDLSPTHRLFLYCCVMIPLLVYYLFRNKNKETIHYVLLFISIATLDTFLFKTDYHNIIAPWSWPLHLCNTAMFLVVICLVFKTKKLFYFTYFINVFGAILAMLMPNYSDSLNIFNEEILYFWINHIIAYSMPLLMVALKVYERPKMKEMFYSIIGFTGYFIFIIIANSLFTAYGHSADFFFTNSDYVANQLGTWAEKLFDIEWTFTLFDGAVVSLHPLYQFLFYLVYVAITFAMWFIYSLFFDLFDSLGNLEKKRKQQKLDYYALLSQLDGRSLKEPMIENTGIKLKIENFSKRYGSSDKYAVHHASLEVSGGEIFGFLGPNGAGKSTTIKCIVGIQTITKGSIQVCGYDVSKQPVEAKRLIGYVPDHYALYENLTGREYINYIADIYNVSQEDRCERIERLTKLLHLEDVFDVNMRTYSHGMKQKIAIIAALIHNPKLWILDEPLTGLDPDSIFQVKECMRKHAQEGNIVMFSSHIIDVVENLCSKVVVINKGHMGETISIDEIHKNETLEQYYLKKTQVILEAESVEKESNDKLLVEGRK